MTKVMSWLRIITIACFISLITACGQKGDLYLPDANSHSTFIG